MDHVADSNTQRVLIRPGRHVARREGGRDVTIEAGRHDSDR